MGAVWGLFPAIIAIETVGVIIGFTIAVSLLENADGHAPFVTLWFMGVPCICRGTHKLFYIGGLS